MGALGHVALVVALAAAVWCGAAAVLARRRGPAVAASARAAFGAVLVAVVTANALMAIALLRNDFTLSYVAANSDLATPTWYRAVALWSGDEGSLLLWNLVLACFAALVALRSKPGTRPTVWAVLAGVQVCYLVLVLVADPFAASPVVPADGDGAQPLLRSNVLMAIHPPVLYCGLIGLTVPFALTVAALVDGHDDAARLEAARRWMTAAWCFLTAGLLLGALWAYVVLGWGGYWAWDPVENAALLPWLTTTAYLHSSMVQRRRGLLRVWNPSLVITTFALSVLGTFLTRGSLLTSVHSFATSAVGPVYLGMLVVVVVGGFGLVAARAGRLRADAAGNAALSRESLVLGNNVLLSALAAAVLGGTLYPIVAELVDGTRVAVGKPFYEQTTVPLLLVLLVLAGVGPAASWRTGSAATVARRVAPSAACALVAGAAVGLLGGASPGTALGVTAAVFAGSANVVELVRSRSGWRSHGGLIAHTGLAVAALGIVFSSGQAQYADVTLRPGEHVAALGSDVRFAGLDEHAEPGLSTLTARLELFRPDAAPIDLTPQLTGYRGSTDPTGLPAIHRGWWQDTYVALLAVSRPDDHATFRLYVNPGMTWLWLGGAITVLGGLLAGLSRRGRTAEEPLVPAGVGAP